MSPEQFTFDDLSPPEVTLQRALKRAIIANNEVGWRSFGIAALESLSPQAVLAATVSLARLLPPVEYDQIKGAFSNRCFGLPLPPLLSPMKEARWWAEYATTPEHEAFCIVCFQAMALNRQKDFLRAVAQ